MDHNASPILSTEARNDDSRPAAALGGRVAAVVDAEYPSLLQIYKDLHQHPELSCMEVRTAAIVAKELRALGLDVTEGVGGTGVVGVLRNGPGPTLLVRGDMDALPMAELTGLPYAAAGLVKDRNGSQSPAMHSCGHDSHTTQVIGSARVMAALKDAWSGTLVFVGQPAEEVLVGARAMIADGLYTRFPRPDIALGLHTAGHLPAGQIGYTPGHMLAAVASVEITVYGIGGHGAMPELAIDPIVLASQIVLALQTIVSRQLKPGTPAVLTVGSIHGGTKNNIIPDRVKLDLTLRAYEDAVMEQMIAAIRRTCDGLAAAAGMPEDRRPEVTLTADAGGATYCDPQLAHRLAGTFRTWFGDDRVVRTDPIMGAEDFAEYGRTPEKVPLAFWWVGGTAPELFEESKRTGRPVPFNHSPYFAPVPEPTLKTCVTSMAAALLELLAKR